MKKQVLRGMTLFLVVMIISLLAFAVTTSDDLFKTSKLTKENFLKVRTGMLPSDVRVIFGQPTQKSTFLLGYSEAWTYREEKKTVTIFFDEDGRVSNKDESGL
jgi:outer membrane protein assembly factor BamE (lipoprotein component of BamABCDE complex)